MKRLLEVLQASAEYLAGKGVADPRLQAEQLMSHVLHCSRMQLYVRFETILEEPQLVPLRDGIRRLAAGEPLQYVLGDVEFMGHRFKVDRRALIPRPDTETLVTTVLDCQPLWMTGSAVIADVGTGTGCVAISLAKERPTNRFVAVDAHSQALELARENADMNGVSDRIGFRQGDLLSGFGQGELDAVVSNPPYISTTACGELPHHIRNHEPLSALDGGADGLAIIRRLISGAREVLKSGGWLFVEIGFDQGSAVVGLLRDNGFEEIVVRPDLGGRDRVVVGRVPRGRAATGEGNNELSGFGEAAIQRPCV